jgi:sulfite oxidase
MQQFEYSSINRRRFLQFSAGMGLAAFAGRTEFVEAFQAKSPQGTALKVLTESPMNAEPNLQDLVADWITPNKFFYIRSHGPNPTVNPATYRLKVEGLVEKPLEFSLDELKQKFEPHSAVATLTCAGNRREEFNEIKKVGGVQWGAGAVGNADWEGARLSDVLKAAGLNDEAKHVWFEGLDEVPEGNETTFFGGSIPLSKALADTDEMPGALLSYNMNREPLTVDHGFPLRAVVPGYIGARSVKWLSRIIVSNRPSPNHFVAEAYKLVTEDTPLAWDEAGVIYNFQVNSAIADPAPAGKVSAGTVKVRGYAMPAGDGSRVAKVEVSADAGRTWIEAKLLSKADPYCWAIWEAEVPVTNASRLLVARATDSKGNTQPQTVPWNVKGYMNNAWHKRTINVT